MEVAMPEAKTEELGDGGDQAEKKALGHHGGGTVVHIHIPHELMSRIRTVLALTEMETISHMGRVGFKRLCESVEARQKALDELNGPDDLDNPIGGM